VEEHEIVALDEGAGETEDRPRTAVPGLADGRERRDEEDGPP
jgi:hypothetical protein